MTIRICRTYIEVARERGEARVHNVSHLLHRLKVLLNRANRPPHAHELVKVRMWKDRHLYGDNTTQYLVQRNRRTAEDPIMIYDGNYMLRDAATAFNAGDTVLLIKDGEFPK